MYYLQKGGLLQFINIIPFMMHHRLILIVIKVLSILCVIASQALNAQPFNWANGGGHPGRFGWINRQGPTSDSLLWTRARPGLFGMPAYTEGNRVVSMRFLSLTNAPVECYELRTGLLLWSVDVTGGTGRSLPVGLRNGRVFVVRYTESQNDSLFALDVQNGNRLWAASVRVNPYIGSSATFDSAGQMYIEGNGVIYRINPINGASNWQINTIPFASGGGEMSIHPPNHTGYTHEQIGGVSYLWATDLSTGIKKYNHIINDTYPGGPLPQAPLMVGPSGIIYVHKQGDNISAFSDDGTRLQLLWEAPITGSAPFSHPCLGPSGDVYVPSGGRVLRLSPTSGTPIDSSPIIASNPDLFQMRASTDAEGTVYVTNGENAVYSFTPNLQFRWMHYVPNVNTCAPVFGTDGIVVVSGGGVIKAFAPPQLSSSVFAYESSNWRVFPNPSSEPPMLWVDDIRDGAEYTLFDVGGRIIASGPVFKGLNSLSWGAAPSGLYHLVFWDGRKRHTTKLLRIPNSQ